MHVEIVDPRSVPSWDEALSASGDHSFFHSSSWAAVLAESYRYSPVYLTCRDRNRVSLVWPLMEIRSSLTGKRGVSLPFTDRCAPFSLDGDLLREAHDRAMRLGRAAKWRYIEWRDSGPVGPGFPEQERYLAHDLCLEDSEQALFSGLAESNRRNIRKARREGVSVALDRSADSLRSFYRLHCLTRRRHGLPPQPSRFFEKIHEHILARGRGVVALARHGDQTIAAAVFFLSGPQAIFKYGASNMAHQRVRPNNLLMWESLLWLKSHGCLRLDLGRTQPDHPGLLRFKRAWGGTETSLTYRRYSFGKEAYVAGRHSDHGRYARLLSRAPLPLLRVLGELAYRHVG